MSTYCHGCKQPTMTHTDDTMGHTVCINCGSVLEENAVVAEVQFSEKANGATVSDGFFIGAGQARAKSGGASGYSRFGMSAQDANEQREISLQNGYRRIAAVANSLRMTQRQIEAAERWFKLAASHNFTKGRKTANVAAACLYIVCRMEKTSHMLIDFSDVLQTNVFMIGSTYVRLVDILHLREKIPHLDPALYIARFAARLEFEELTQKVITDSLRLVSRMDRDWMKLGRRPSGICAAALFIAARMNGFKRTVNEIVHVVKICEATLRKRLEEFQSTPSGSLTVEDFQNIWLEGSQDPPCFIKKKEKEALAVATSVKRKLADLAADENNQENQDQDTESIAQEMREALTAKELKDILHSIECKDDQDLSTLDQDLEVQGAVLSQAEIEFKTIIWTDLNKDWLELQEMKKNAKPAPPKVRKQRASGTSRKQTVPLPPAASAAEAAKNLVSTKRILSKKINYDVLEGMFD